MRIYSTRASDLHDPGQLGQPSGGSPNYFSEVAARLDVLIDGILGAGLPTPVTPVDRGLEPILAVHSRALVELVEHGLERARAEGEEIEVLVSETFAVGARTLPTSGSVWADLGIHTFDTSSPLFPGTFAAAYHAAQCAVAAADAVNDGEPCAFALVRPPGHHAMRDAFGGFCYFNNAAVAAARLQSFGRRVAVIDVDVHHGNGTQEIFWDDPSVLTVSLHMDPRFEYPYFWGHASETGGAVDSNLNVALPLGTDDLRYFEALGHAVSVVQRFSPDAVVLALGVDTYALDPIGKFELSVDAYPRIGAAIASLGMPVVVTQEGGYHLESLGSNVASVLIELVG